MKIRAVLTLLVMMFSLSLTALTQTKTASSDTGYFGIPLTDLQKVYRDESHCLTQADMRGDQDMPISCFCRDALVDARYVYSKYAAGDGNLSGPLLHLLDYVDGTCEHAYGYQTVSNPAWKWNGPEVVRMYPSDEAIQRIMIEKSGSLRGRWVPFTVQLVYRDDGGHVTRTENYSSRESVPDFSLDDAKHSD